MKKLALRFTFLFITTIISNIYAQDVIEVPSQEYSSTYLKDIKAINEIEAKNPKMAIQLLETLLKKGIKPFEEYDIMCFRLPSLYAIQKEYEKCLAIWNKALDKEYFFLLYPGADPYPEYLNEISNKEMLQKIVTRNTHLRDKFGSTSNAEYFVKTPAKYSTNKKYPVIMVFHGGYGTHKGSYENWRSPAMSAEYVVVYLQGTIVGGAYLRRFDSKNYSQQIQSTYSQVKQKYSIDTSRVVLCGPSAGGLISVQLAMKNVIPAKGLILAFPVKPRDLDSNYVKGMAANGIRAAIIAGENDWALKGQKEMGVLFDKYGLEHRFLVFPETGHEFPREFEKHMDRSLEFILKMK